MKKILSILTVLAMVLTCASGFAEETVEETAEVTATATPAPVITAKTDYDHLTVGVVTPLYGDFFTSMWGNNTSDIDVRTLIHGYSPVKWSNEGVTYATDPSVVTGITVTEDASGNRTYTVALAEDLVYSDGTPINAYDYAFSLLLNVAPEMAAIGADTENADYIYGIDEYLDGTNTYLSGVRVTDNYTLAITVKAAYEPFFYELEYLNVSPYPISVIAPGCEVADDGNGVYIRNIDQTVTDPIFTAELLTKTILDDETGYKTHPSVVSGMYTLVSYDADTHTAEFERNANFKGNSDGQLPAIEKITVVPVNSDDMFEKLQNADIDLIHKTVKAASITEGIQLANNDAYSAGNYPRSGFAYISFNCERPAVSSQAVRQAIYMCMDKDSLMNDSVGNYGIGVNAHYGLGQWMYQLVNGTLAAPVTEPAEDATEEEKAAYETESAAWEALNMDGVPTYTFDVDAAVALLEQDGWTLNENGEEFDPAADTVRCKTTEDGTLVKLDLKLVAADSVKGLDLLNTYFVENLAKAGIALTVETVSAGDLFNMYYGEQDRDCDMLMLASNFTTAYDPSPLYAYTVDEEDGSIDFGDDNYNQIADEELYQLALDLRATTPGDVLTYCQKWVKFQTRWAELLPAIPLYSNVYFDFYTATLHDYNVTENVSWPNALYNAYFGDISPVQEAAEEDMEIENEAA